MKIKFIDMLVKMANDDNFRPITIKFYNDLFVWNNLYKDWLKEDGKGLLEYNFPDTLNNEIEIIDFKSEVE